jgi:hypothetical protein
LESKGFKVNLSQDTINDIATKYVEYIYKKAQTEPLRDGECEILWQNALPFYVEDMRKKYGDLKNFETSNKSNVFYLILLPFARIGGDNITLLENIMRGIALSIQPEDKELKKDLSKENGKFEQLNKILENGIKNAEKSKEKSNGYLISEWENTKFIWGPLLDSENVNLEKIEGSKSNDSRLSSKEEKPLGLTNQQTTEKQCTRNRIFEALMK